MLINFFPFAIHPPPPFRYEVLSVKEYFWKN